MYNPYKNHLENYHLSDYIPPPKEAQEGETKMTTLKEYAQAYEPPQTKNISELDKIPIDVEVTEETHTRKDTNPPEQFTVKVITIEGEKYRVPNSVLDSMKALLEKMPDMKYISVLKSGDGMKTRYQVVPFQN